MPLSWRPAPQPQSGRLPANTRSPLHPRTEEEGSSETCRLLEGLRRRDRLRSPAWAWGCPRGACAGKETPRKSAHDFGGFATDEEAAEVTGAVAGVANSLSLVWTRGHGGPVGGGSGGTDPEELGLEQACTDEEEARGKETAREGGRKSPPEKAERGRRRSLQTSSGSLEGLHTGPPALSVPLARGLSCSCAQANPRRRDAPADPQGHPSGE